jgi:hypothetical protein
MSITSAEAGPLSHRLTHSPGREISPGFRMKNGHASDLLIDYSSGTGILTRRLVDSISYPVGILNVDASPKFLRVALESFRDDERVAFRPLRWRPGGLAFSCSGNMRNPHGRPDEWIIDETVARVNDIAADIVQAEPAFAEYRQTLDDAALMSRHAKLRKKVSCRSARSSSTWMRSGTPDSACSTSSRKPSSPASTSGTAC